MVAPAEPRSSKIAQAPADGSIKGKAVPASRKLDFRTCGDSQTYFWRCSLEKRLSDFRRRQNPRRASGPHLQNLSQWVRDATPEPASLAGSPPGNANTAATGTTL